MRLLLDESVPYRFRRALPGHEVRTGVEMGWSGVKNGKLLALALAVAVAVIVLDSVSNELSALLPLVPALERVLTSLEPRSYVRVDSQS